MDTVFISKLKFLFDPLEREMPLYVPRKEGSYYSFVRYIPSGNAEYNQLRLCTSAKEFLFPLREIAAVFPGESETETEIKPFAVFGLKDCDLRAIAILDKVFADEEFRDPSYVQRREKMFIISSDCIEPAESCCCSLFGGQAYPQGNYDLNVSKITDGFIVQAGSDKGRAFLRANEGLFAEVPHSALQERDGSRQAAQQELEKNTREFQFDTPIRELVLNGRDSELFGQEAKGCVECQACTRICPTCHCFYLYDRKKEDYYDKMKIWDSCVRTDFTTVAGGENPRQRLADRSRHRLLHKFVYFLDRYGIQMCVGCGRCVDACAGETDIRQVLKKLSEEQDSKRKAKR